MKGFLFSLIAIFTLSLPAQASETLTVVPNEKVCMVTDMYFGKPQIPVTHAGKTYYGCCQNCKKTLGEDAKARTGKDALTGESVDKATAIIAAKSDNSVLYFANQKNLDTYKKRETPKTN